MKKLLAFTLVLIFFSCNNDDDDTVDACVEATNIQANDITTTSATITWTDSNAANSYVIEYGISGFALGTGSTLTETTISTDLSNLNPATSYDVYVQVVCSTNNPSMYSEVFSFTTETPAVVAEFRPNLSELNLFSGELSDLNISSKAFEYQLNSQLFTDYAHKQRLIALPDGTSMEFDGDGLPVFPDNTVIAKTFYYNIDERDLSLGRIIIETRILIKLEGEWETGDYKWNAEQTDAVLDLDGSTVPITWTNATGETNSIDYQIPSNADCFTCHKTYEQMTPIGSKLRSMNFEVNGSNQLDQLINNNQLIGITSSSSVAVSLPNWEDTSLSLETRARAYLDINCAHCHIPGGHCENESILNLAFRTSAEDSNIANRRFSIDFRISSDVDGTRMPLIGTTIQHTEGVQLIQDYLNTLD
ncbi:fibronectin type III domain-containing protein [Winogradskyella luteola]|uniref:Fibronectin type III domain-containing protein n=1 Tax=Winogradskyella luteola TaxID=2828330 RepID=A0A9X1FBE9_9FLAO|nr:fibronectin type III domain-containing protein [Winogradskyella luteola]MBV7270614.1 fibronectin type III domain-containing protein [Winogradskyella luteola]